MNSLFPFKKSNNESLEYLHGNDAVVLINKNNHNNGPDSSTSHHELLKGTHTNDEHAHE